MELFVADGEGKNPEADHKFRMCEFRADVYAGWEEDSVRFEQAQLRRPEIRAVSDQYGRHGFGASDGFRRIHGVSRVRAGWQNRSCSRRIKARSHPTSSIFLRRNGSKVGSVLAICCVVLRGPGRRARQAQPPRRTEAEEPGGVYEEVDRSGPRDLSCRIAPVATARMARRKDR